MKCFRDQAIKEIDAWQWQKKSLLAFGSAGILIEYAATLKAVTDEENRPAIRCLIIANVSNTVLIDRDIAKADITDSMLALHLSWIT